MRISVKTAHSSNPDVKSRVNASSSSGSVVFCYEKPVLVSLTILLKEDDRCQEAWASC